MPFIYQSNQNVVLTGGGVASRQKEKGKLANLYITTGNPLDLRTQVVGVFIKGRDMPFDDRQTRLYLKYKGRPAPIKP